ncbi:unnamed protein product, partial [Mesorhabditis belari]|uniref:Uncharacterized protein n=1 Tax=Mesorhabditis belari TaxID=2138241 RepID=A0AAF3FF33_9BILA
MKQFTLVFCLLGAAFALECYNGMKFIAGSTIGESTVQCGDSKEYCYNISVRGMVILDVLKGGCSFWRCLLAQDRCITTQFQGSPASFCCCSQNLCNVADQRGREFHIGSDQSSFGEPIRPEIHRGSESSNGDSDRFNNNNNNNNNNGQSPDRFQTNDPSGSPGGGNMGSNFDRPQNMQARPMRTRLDDDNSREMPRQNGDEIIL